MPVILRALLRQTTGTLCRSEKSGWLLTQISPIHSGLSCIPNAGVFHRCPSRWSIRFQAFAGQQTKRAQDFALPAPLYAWCLKTLCTASEMAEQRYCVDYAKRGTAGCKKCKEKILKGMVRIGKVVPNPFTESGGDMKEWYHVKCMFEKLERARATTKKIEDLTDLEGWEQLQDAEKEMISQLISGETLRRGHMSGDSAPRTLPIRLSCRAGCL